MSQQQNTSASAAERSPRKPHAKGPWYTSFGFQVLAGLVLGVVFGLIARQIGPNEDGSNNALLTTLSTVGSNYVLLLQTIVVPLILTAVISSIANLRKVTNAAKLAGSTILWFAITSLISVAVGIGLGVIFRPGAGVAGDPPEGWNGTEGSWLGFLNGLFPSNILGLSARSSETADGTISTSLSFNVLQVLVIAIAFGIAALKAGRRAEPFLTFVDSALRIVRRVLWWIIRLTPLATIGLLGRAVASYQWEQLGALGNYAVVIYIGLAIVLFVVYPILLRTHGLSIRKFFSGAWPAIQLAFVSRSSVGTMPLTERLTERNLGVPVSYASFAVPLGATTKMDGCAAIYPAVSAVFVAQFFGIELTIVQYLLIAFVSVLGSTATAGTTGAVVMLTLTLSTVGLPLEGVALLLAIDPILDMGRTAVNVAGQALVPTIVAKRHDILDQDAYNAPRDNASIGVSDDEDDESGRGGDADGNGPTDADARPTTQPVRTA